MLAGKGAAAVDDGPQHVLAGLLDAFQDPLVADVEKDVLGRVLCQPEASWLGNVDLEVVGGEPETMLRELLPNRRRHAACIQASG